MDEIKFVLRCFGFAAVLLVVSQLKTKTGTLETDIQGALVSSQSSELVNKVADGGAKMLRDGATYLSNKYKQSQAKAAPAAAPQATAASPAPVTVNQIKENVKENVKEAVATVQNKTAAYTKAADQKIQEIYNQSKETTKSVQEDSTVDSSEEPIEEIQ